MIFCQGFSTLSIKRQQFSALPIIVTFYFPSSPVSWNEIPWIMLWKYVFEISVLVDSHSHRQPSGRQLQKSPPDISSGSEVLSVLDIRNRILTLRPSALADCSPVKVNCILLLAPFLFLTWLAVSELKDERYMFLRNVCWLSPDYTLVYLKWEPQGRKILNGNCHSCYMSYSYDPLCCDHPNPIGQCIPAFFLSRNPWLGFSFMSTLSLQYPR
jgi:hypothetical protein